MSENEDKGDISICLIIFVCVVFSKKGKDEKKEGRRQEDMYGDLKYARISTCTASHCIGKIF